MYFIIIETYEGLTVAEVPADSSAEQVVAQHGATLIDPGPYPSYDEAYDALLALSEGAEDVPEE